MVIGKQMDVVTAGLVVGRHPQDSGPVAVSVLDAIPVGDSMVIGKQMDVVTAGLVVGRPPQDSGPVAVSVLDAIPVGAGLPAMRPQQTPDESPALR